MKLIIFAQNHGSDYKSEKDSDSDNDPENEETEIGSDNESNEEDRSIDDKGKLLNETSKSNLRTALEDKEGEEEEDPQIDENEAKIQENQSKKAKSDDPDALDGSDDEDYETEGQENIQPPLGCTFNSKIIKISFV